MNIFQRIWRFFFPEKQKALPTKERVKQFNESIDDFNTEDTSVSEPILPVKKELLYGEMKSVKEINIPVHTLQQAKTALSNEWNKPKAKNKKSVNDKRDPRNYERIKMLYKKINSFKAAA